MRPINLIPSDIKLKRIRQETGIFPYVVTGALAVIVLGVLAYVLMQNQVTSKKDEVAELTSKVTKAQTEADAISEYGKFAELKLARQASLGLIAQSRFPWAEVLFDISKALPSNAWLTEATGKVSPAASSGGESDSDSSKGGGGDDSEGVSVPGPTIELIGCTYRQIDVARMMTRLRNVSGVRQVLLKESKEKENADQGSSSGSAAEQQTDCRTKVGIHKFEVTLTFAPGLATMMVTARATAAKLASQPPVPAPSDGESKGDSDSTAAEPTKAASQ